MKIIYIQWKSYQINYIIDVELYLTCNQINTVIWATTMCNDTGLIQFEYHNNKFKYFL